MKQSLIGFLIGAIISGAVFYFIVCKNNGNQTSSVMKSPEIDTIIKGKKYFVVKTRDSLSNLNHLDSSSNLYHLYNLTEASFGGSVITPENAEAMIKEYQKKNPPSAPAFIDFNFDEIYEYLDYIYQNEQRHTADFGVRLYFGTHTAGTADTDHLPGSLSLILVATDANRVDYYPNLVNPIDYGNLCPPSTNCVDSTNKNQLIYKARRLNP